MGCGTRCAVRAARTTSTRLRTAPRPGHAAGRVQLYHQASLYGQMYFVIMYLTRYRWARKHTFFCSVIFFNGCNSVVSTHSRARARGSPARGLQTSHCAKPALQLMLHRRSAHSDQLSPPVPCSRSARRSVRLLGASVGASVGASAVAAVSCVRPTVCERASEQVRRE